MYLLAFSVLPPVEIDNVEYVSPDMSLLYETPAHSQHMFIAFICFLLYVLGIPFVFLCVLWFRRHNIFNLIIASDIGEFQMFYVSKDGSKLKRRDGKTTMSLKYADKNRSDASQFDLTPLMKYTVVEFDEDSGIAVLASNSDDGVSLRVQNVATDYNAVTNIGLGWLCANYEPAFWYWELVEFLRKFVLSSALIFFNPGECRVQMQLIGPSQLN